MLNFEVGKLILKAVQHAHKLRMVTRAAVT